jgi:hypothetical protein
MIQGIVLRNLYLRYDQEVQRQDVNLKQSNISIKLKKSFFSYVQYHYFQLNSDIHL